MKKILNNEEVATKIKNIFRSKHSWSKGKLTPPKRINNPILAKSYPKPNAKQRKVRNKNLLIAVAYFKKYRVNFAIAKIVIMIIVKISVIKTISSIIHHLKGII